MATKGEHIIKAYMGDEPYIFISYAHHDADTVLKIVQWLQAGGYRVWYDEGIRISEDFTNEIALSLENCSYFIVFISNYSISRKFVQKEINYAEKINKAIIPIYLEKNVLMPPGIRMNISGLQGVEYFRMGWDIFTDYLKKTLPHELIGDEKEPPPSKPRSYRSSKFLKKLKKETREVAGFLLHYIVQILILLIISLALWYLQNKFDLISKLAGVFK